MSLLMIQHIPTSSLVSPPCPLVFPSPGVLAADDIITMVCDDVICSIIIMDFDIDVDSRSGVMELDSDCDTDCDIDVVLDVAGVDIDDIDVDIDDAEAIDCVIELDSDCDIDVVTDFDITDMGDMDVVVDDVDVDMGDMDVDDVDGDMDSVGVVVDDIDADIDNDIDDDIKEFVTNKNGEQKEKLRSASKNPNSYEGIYVVLELVYSHFKPHTKFAIRRCLQFKADRLQMIVVAKKIYLCCNCSSVGCLK